LLCLERTAPVGFLKELLDCLGENASLSSLIDDYQSHLKWHGTQNKFYYQDAGVITFSDAPAFQSNIIHSKVDALHINTAEITQVDRTRLQIVVQYYLDIVRGFSNRVHLAPLLKRLDKRIEDIKKVIEVDDDEKALWKRNIVIVSLKDVSIKMRKVLPLLICKKLYAEHRSTADANAYLNIIIDEAHNILSEKSPHGSSRCLRAASEAGARLPSRRDGGGAIVFPRRLKDLH
jgi:uncharacterized protein